MKRKNSIAFVSMLVLIGTMLTLGSCLDVGGITPYQRLQEDIKKIDDYLALNPPEDPTDIIIKDASGIRMIITEGDLDTILVPPSPNNLLDVAYTGRLFSTGEQFETNNSFVLKLSDDIISGWKYALSMMTQGMKVTVYIPSGLAYGTNGSGSIPKNAILVFDLHLKEINRTDEATQLAADKTKIAQKLDAAEISATTHVSGVSYIIQPLGTGSIPLLYSQVRIRYTGRLIEDDKDLDEGKVFAEGVEQGPVNTFGSRVVNYVHGLSVVLQLMHAGDKATVYIPSSLAFGTVESEVIPANSNVLFEVELLDVVEE